MNFISNQLSSQKSSSMGCGIVDTGSGDGVGSPGSPEPVSACFSRHVLAKAGTGTAVIEELGGVAPQSI